MERKEIICPSCREKNSEIDRKKFWTKETVLVEYERSSKILIVIFSCALIPGIFFLPGHGRAATGWIFAIPPAFLFLMWQTASCITRKDIIFRPSIFWSAFTVLAGLAFTLYILYQHSELGFNKSVIYIALALPVSILWGFIFFISGSKFRKWKSRRIEERQKLNVASNKIVSK